MVIYVSKVEARLTHRDVYLLVAAKISGKAESFENIDNMLTL